MTELPLLEREGWWASLTHGGLLLAPSKLAEYFPELPPPLEGWIETRLRRDVVRLGEGTREARSAFLDTVLEDVTGLPRAGWKKGSDLGTVWSQVSMTRETLRPARVWTGEHGAVLPVFYPETGAGGLGVDRSYRIGVGKGRRSVARVVEWLRKANQKIALLATGRQLRLIHAGADHEAHCEWDAELWFQGGVVGPQVTALRALIGPRALEPAREGQVAPLLAAIQASRQGQAELSSALGERVRLAVERIIAESGGALAAIDAEAGAVNGVARRDLYVAATRIVMRCVVILFAEARELLPRGNPVYEDGYGLQGLRGHLERMAGGRAERLRHGHSAWPRLLALFSLVYHGSAHPELPIPRYGGGLFTPGDAASTDPILRVLAALESPDNAPTDAAVHRILDLLTRSQVSVRQGRSFRTVQAPVDFSDLSSEYIGILYEGLLDFELRRAPEDDAMVFLAVGDQPVLPFGRLSAMNIAEITKLFEKLKKPSKEATDDDEDAAEDDVDDGEADEEPPVDVPDDPEAEEPEPTDGDEARRIREAIHLWAVKAVKDAKIIPLPRKHGEAVVRERWEKDVTARAQSLVRVILPGEWFLVRWGGTRKGSGTFYTRPQLAGPTVRRTLEPLVADDSGAPKRPEEILALKVCDPAMGSGSFLIAALRSLTGALLASLHHHGRIEAHGEACHIRLADGLPATHPSQESLPIPPGHPDFDERLQARLKRHVVERCLYGVDLDPLAVELARLSLWVETMDPYLPFGFLDHKLRCGNSLVGCWLDRLDIYPIRAWEREGGDKQHDRFVHHFREVPAKAKQAAKRAGDKWTWAIKRRREAILRDAHALAAERRTAATQVTMLIDGRDSGALHDEAFATFQELHDIIPVFEAERRAQVYREKILGNPSLRRLREALDAWCAVWFWPGDALEHAPGPLELGRPEVWSAETRRIVREVAQRYRFFHWEIEFPDVFTGPESGFDAVVGNPPWETQKPNSMEFFANHDPLYRTYTKQQALTRQKELFGANPDIELGWIRSSARLKALSNWTKSVGEADATPSTRAFADPEHPFRHQGSADINSYKMFLEVAHSLLRRGGGLGLLVPSGLYTDNGSRALRELFLARSAWTHLYAFQNERFVFETIHHSFKMCVVHVRKAGATAPLLTRFRLGPGDSPETHELVEDLRDESQYLPLPAARIQRFSPTSGSILEIRSRRDLDILEKLYSNGVLLGDQGPNGWGIEYAREFDMTNDSKLFPPRPKWEADGYKPDEYGHWLKGKWRPGNGLRRDDTRDWDLVRSADGSEVIGADQIDDVALPLYQGRMLNNLDFCAAGWVSGTGLKAVWERNNWPNKRLRPQFLMGADDARENHFDFATKVALRDIARSTDERTMIPAVLPGFPCGHVVGVLRTGTKSSNGFVGCLSSIALDWIVRERMGGTHLTWHVLEELPVLVSTETVVLDAVVDRLAYAAPVFATENLRGARNVKVPWRLLWAVTAYERLRLHAILDALVADAYGLGRGDFGWILRECDHPAPLLNDKATTRSLNPKGFWRVDREQPPELRHTVLSLVAFDALVRDGLDAFLAGDGWQLPETLRLADYDLGHDARAREHQPVASLLGPRFLPWQLEQSVEESWEECRRHAELIARIVPTPAAPEAAKPKPGPQRLPGID